MPRPPRLQLPGSIVHVTTRGNDGRTTFPGPDDCDWFLNHLGGVVERNQWECLGYCLMGTHYHVMIRLTKPNLAVGMQVVNGGYARRFNRVHGHTGHLFERRYRSEPVDRESHFLEASRYLPLNPVRAGLCPHPAAWRWSSYRACAGLEAPPRFLAVSELLAFFGGTPAQGRERFVQFVADALP